MDFQEEDRDDSPGLQPLSPKSVAPKNAEKGISQTTTQKAPSAMLNLEKAKRNVTERQREAGLQNLVKAQEARKLKAEERRQINEKDYKDLNAFLAMAPITQSKKSNNKEAPKEVPKEVPKEIPVEVKAEVPRAEIPKTEVMINSVPSISDYATLSNKLEILNSNLEKTYNKVFKLYEHKKNKVKQQQVIQPVVVKNETGDAVMDAMRNKMFNIKK